ncbi:MAG: hypothetical protein WC850_06100 [Candidatus Gracilibacteria bacterium]
MAIYNIREVNFIKLKSLKKEFLKDFCEKYGIKFDNNITKTIENILTDFDSTKISTDNINNYIKFLYEKLRKEDIKVTGASHESIIKELNKVDEKNWGMVQGAVDAHIQTYYVRKYYKFEDLINAVRSELFSKMESYTISTWYNHWSTVFLEDLINNNINVIPIIKKVKGIDVIWNEQPIDIKVTNLPKEWFKSGYNIQYAIDNPKLVAKFLYELQGAQRFGDENRLFIIIYDENNPENSWKIKRNYNLIKSKINQFFDSKDSLEPINFKYGKQQYLAHSKIMFIIK